MSVLTCDRRCCDNIMCNRYSHQFGYLCNECFEKLVDRGCGTNVINFMQEGHGSDATATYFDSIFKKSY